MSQREQWFGKFEAEIGQELGQPVTLAAGGEPPAGARCWTDTIQIPGARLTLAADREDVTAFLIEARVIEARQADSEMVRELWSGILASIASRMGGKASPSSAQAPSAEPCGLRLGNAQVRLSLSVEAAGVEARPEVRPEAGSERGSERGAPAPGSAAAAAVQHPAGNFDLLLEVELEASVRFGSREMELKDLLELGPGDVVELDRQVADPVDLIVGDRIVARGEVVLVNGNFGLRVIEVAEPVRRLESIRCLW